jgi:hypothetical protein
MRRRDFITLLGGTAAAWPFAAREQQPAIPVVGFLCSGTFTDNRMTPFRQGMKEAGFVEGQNVAVEYRSAEGRLPALGLGPWNINRRLSAPLARAYLPDGDGLVWARLKKLAPAQVRIII